MTHSHSYNITPNYLIGCVCHKGINDILNDRKLYPLLNFRLKAAIKQHWGKLVGSTSVGLTNYNL